MKDYSLIAVKKDTHERIKDFSKKTGLKMYRIVEDLVKEGIPIENKGKKEGEY
jgi:hypothetical protein